VTVRVSVPGGPGAYLDVDTPIHVVDGTGLVRVDLGAVDIIGPIVEVHDLFIAISGRLADAVVHSRLPNPEETT
jgi:hypothetical protein